MIRGEMLHVGQGVRIIKPGILYGKKVWVKAIQLNIEGKASSVIVENRDVSETELTLKDISTDTKKRKFLPQTEMFF